MPPQVGRLFEPKPSPAEARFPDSSASVIPRSLRAGQHLFWEGHSASEIWSIQQGALKTYTLSGASVPRVTGFFFAGGVIGWEALVCGTFPYNAVALEKTLLVRHPSAEILDGVLGSQRRLAQLLDGVRYELLRLETMVQLDRCLAEQRLAVFLMLLAERQHQNGTDFYNVRLPMTRIDIGSYLGLAAETVCRHLAAFDEQGLIKLSRRAIVINDLTQLQRLARI